MLWRLADVIGTEDASIVARASVAVFEVTALSCFSMSALAHTLVTMSQAAKDGAKVRALCRPLVSAVAWRATRTHTRQPARPFAPDNQNPPVHL